MERSPDTVGPYSVKQICKKTGKVFTLQLAAMTMIDPVTNWFEIVQIPADFGSDHITNAFHDHWLARYPRPCSVTYDNGKEFKRFFKQLVEDYHLEDNPSTVKNPQSNGVIERVHGTIKKYASFLRYGNVRFR